MCTAVCAAREFHSCLTVGCAKYRENTNPTSSLPPWGCGRVKNLFQNQTKNLLQLYACHNLLVDDF